MKKVLAALAIGGVALYLFRDKVAAGILSVRDRFMTMMLPDQTSSETQDPKEQLREFWTSGLSKEGLEVEEK